MRGCPKSQKIKEIKMKTTHREVLEAAKKLLCCELPNGSGGVVTRVPHANGWMAPEFFDDMLNIATCAFTCVPAGLADAELDDEIESPFASVELVAELAIAALNSFNERSLYPIPFFIEKAELASRALNEAKELSGEIGEGKAAGAARRI